MAVSYDQIFKEEYNKQLGDSVTRLQQSQAQQEKALRAGYDQQQQKLTENKNKALREAYISKMKEERDMPSTMARQGLNGGMTESNIASIQRNYQNNRNAAETNYNDNRTSLDVGYEGDLANIRSQYVDAIASARQNAHSLALTSAGQRYNAAVAEEEKAKAEAEAAAAAAQAASSGGSGGSSRSGSPSADADDKVPEVENNGTALANQSGLASTGSDNTATPEGSKTYKSYDYQTKYLNGQKYIYKYGVKSDGSKVYLGMSKAASQSNTNSLSGQSGLASTSGQSGQNTSSKLVTNISTVTIAGKKYRKTTYANGQVKYKAI